MSPKLYFTKALFFRDVRRHSELQTGYRYLLGERQKTRQATIGNTLKTIRI